MNPITDSPLFVWGCYCSKALFASLAYSTLPMSCFTLPYLASSTLPYLCPTLFCIALHCLPYPWPCMSCLITVKGAIIGVVPYFNKLIKHEKVVPVNRSIVCATTLKHQTFALPFFPSYLLPSHPPSLLLPLIHLPLITPLWSPLRLFFSFFWLP